MATFTEYADHDGLGLADLIARREVKPEEVLEAAIERADAVNPTINAIVHRMDAIARGRVAADLPTGPFAGVPFLLKDLYVGYEGSPVSNGSRLWKDYISPANFTYTERCRDAGLVVFGRTNSPELGIAWTTEPVAHGPTRNPWDLERTAGGSSGGAAAAVAAGIVPIAHATDGGGSIRIPAAQCGLFGLKPTRGRNPAGPYIGEGWSGLATGHVVSRSVRDSAAMLDATSGPAPGDPYAAPTPARPFLKEVGADPGRLRVALHTTGLDGRPLDPENATAANQAAHMLRELGHEIDEAMPVFDLAALNKAFRVIIAGNLWNAVSMRYAALDRDPDGEGLEKATWEWAQEGRTFTASDYAASLTAIHVAGRQLAQFFENYDAMLSTTMREPPVKLGTLRQNEQGLDDYMQALMGEMPVTPLFNSTGCPAMSVPLHWTAGGLPVGIHFGAAFGREDLLIRLASQLEQAKPWFDRRPDL
jgi:amidase